LGPTGSVIVWNASFEKGRLKELATLFPAFEKKLMSIHDRVFDLMNVVDTKTSFYKDHGYPESKAKLPNFVHEDLQGSYSIKKVLPVFTDITYDNLAIGNGSVAMISYANLPNMDRSEKEKTRSALIAYCQQDTWAMVEITRSIQALLEA
jgi:ATP-dependent protease HslVU (ClpYQ) peptidase subunit